MFERKIGIAPIVTDLKYLRQISRKTSKREVEKRELVVAIKLAIKTAWINGYGLTAVQLGIPIRAAWYWFPIGERNIKETLLINPVIIEKSNPIIIPGEGCLSIPNRTFSVRRYNTIVFENEGEEKKEVTGKEAQIIQHEIDHFEGKIICDTVYKSSTIGRNDPCICGSGKKYKRCCLEKIS